MNQGAPPEKRDHRGTKFFYFLCGTLLRVALMNVLIRE